ncbi:protein suppressor of variegation 3-7 isoform X2 [Musca domestica]|uniref:Protein suppressor of variegation 3-7 isoform X2 n=1 Tax=Musca domestica TaxID=7370 RepID=A0A1I8NHI2_MUSDO|nr:protein suppressor of variegation 3-7 isoform X2 [Musca domestica]
MDVIKDVPSDSDAAIRNKTNGTVGDAVCENTPSKNMPNDGSMIVESLNGSTLEENMSFGNDVENNTHDDSFGNDNCQTEHSETVRTTEFVVVPTTSIAPEKFFTNADADTDTGIKDELTEPITDAIPTGEACENDPMDLLVLNNRSNSLKSNEEEEGDNEDAFDDYSSIGSTSTHGTLNSTNISEWCKEFPWLLYEESDESFGYCLYCDVRLSVRSACYIKQHNMSLYHKERSDNYLSFKEEEERNRFGTPLFEIKQEIGTDSYVAALKLKRKTQAEALNNFNWRRWLEEYPWLERDSATGTIGICKYCNVRINVEFSYLRTRHQETSKHKEFEKEYNSSGQRDGSLNKSDDFQNNTKSNEDNDFRCKSAQDEFAVLRCKICDITVAKNNFKRHLRTNLHLKRESEYVKSNKARKSKKTNSTDNESQEVSSKTSHEWHLYTKQHPWLIADPSDKTQAYCKYCEKRLIYGNSAAKRATHENSVFHKNQEKNIKGQLNESRGGEKSNIVENSEEDQNNGDESDEEGNTEAEDGNDPQEENDEASEESEDEENDDNDKNHEDDEEDEENEEAETDEAHDQEEDNKADESRKRIFRNDSEWYKQYPWCKKYKPDPLKYCFCSFCKIVISKRCNRMKHSQTGRHVAAEAEYLRKHRQKKNLYLLKKPNETFEWAVDIKSQPSLYYCKYCRVRISRRYSKKQHSISKIHQINENLFKTSRKPVKQENNIVTQQTSLKRQETPPLSKVEKVPSLITLIKQWQKKFLWLSYKRSESRSNYAFCKICEQSVYVRTIKSVIKHQRSGKHIRTTNQLRRQKLQQQREEQDEANHKIIADVGKREIKTTKAKDTSPISNAGDKTPEVKKSQSEIAVSNIIDEMQKRYSWLKRSSKPNCGHCPYCNENVYLKPMFLKNHSNSRNHRQSVVKYRINVAKGEKRRHSESNATSEDVDDGDDVILIEDNAEEILISEQDDNWTVKSENMDEHEALDFLLQRSGKSAENTPPHGRPSKRAKKCSPFHRLNENSASLVASILSTPLTLASCLGPLIQQQIQQATSSQIQQSPTIAQPSTSAVGLPQQENSLDLFFKSVSETMKNFPTDLAAEGKVKIMQIICDLELKALKRQQQCTADIIAAPNDSSSNLANNSPAALNISVSDQSEHSEAITNKTTYNNSPAPSQPIDQTGTETILTPITGESSVNGPHSNPKSSLTNTNVASKTLTKESNKDSHTNANQQPPIIGLMDKNGLHTLQFKNSAIVKQITKSGLNPTNNTMLSTSAIRCIPLKNLSHSAGPEANAKFTRIQMPIAPSTTTSVHSPQSSPNISVSERSKAGMVNVRSIQIAKRPNLVQQTTATSTVTTNSLSSKSPNCNYTVTTQNIQRFSQNPNVSMNNQIAVNNYNVSRQKTPPTSRSYHS